MERGAMIVAGFGFRAAAPAEALAAALAAAGGAAGLDALATAADKADAPALAALGRALGLPVLAAPLDALCAAPAAPGGPLAPARYGGRSLAEAAALAVAGPGARLRAPRSVSPCRRATCAIAEGAAP
jgi:cobalt-precorrin 5A hydrolase